MKDLIYSMLGYDPITKKLSTTEFLTTTLVTSAIIASFAEIAMTFIYGSSILWGHYEEFMQYSIGGATGSKFTKGLATTVQNIYGKTDAEGKEE